jgi:hypothetical protein
MQEKLENEIFWKIRLTFGGTISEVQIAQKTLCIHKKIVNLFLYSSSEQTKYWTCPN